MVVPKPAPPPAKFAANLAKEVREVEEARRRRESIVAAKAPMHRHRVGDKVAHGVFIVEKHLGCAHLIVWFS